MAAGKSNFLDRVLGRIGRLDAEGMQTVVQRLARERNFLETLFNAIEDGVLVVDETGRILYFNQAVTRLLGLQAQQAEGQLVSRYLPELDWSKLLTMEAGGGQRLARLELEIEYPRPRLLHLYAAPLGGEPAGNSGVALVLHDATEARAQTYAAIESERIQALTLLAASVAHEIGNPLNALHIHLQLMERELRKLKAVARIGSPGEKPAVRRGSGEPELPALSAAESAGKLERYLGVAKGEIIRLDYIVTQFLQAIRPTPPKFLMAQVNDVVRETVELLRPEVENRGIQVRERLARPLPTIPLDPAQIKQALVNLIKNAIQAMTKGGVLTLQTESAMDGIWVNVADTGVGIPSDKVKRIFEPFYTTKKKGSGLGLMIVQRIVRDHGGRLELQSYVNEGTTFRIWLPSQEKRPRLLEAGLAGWPENNPAAPAEGE